MAAAAAAAAVVDANAVRPYKQCGLRGSALKAGGVVCVCVDLDTG